MKKILLLVIVSIFTGATMFAGNPDRQGEAGAGELLINPWAASSGLHTLNTASISGVEAMRLNVAGIGRGFEKTSLALSNTQMFVGTGVQVNSFGVAQKISQSHTLGVSIVSLDFGDIPITTYELPEGTGGNFSPRFLQLGVGYAYTYQNKISVGVLFRTVSETLDDVAATAFAVDAGVSYVAGEKENFKLGVSIRNVGTPMKFGGEGLSFLGKNPDGDGDYQLTFSHRPAGFELPSLLNIGVSYDFYLESRSYIRALGNFTSNAFSLDELGAGLEANFRNFFVARVAYKYEIGTALLDERNAYSGLAAGFSVMTPLKKGSNRKISLDYAYRATHVFNGTHNFGVRLEI